MSQKQGEKIIANFSQGMPLTGGNGSTTLDFQKTYDSKNQIQPGTIIYFGDGNLSYFIGYSKIDDGVLLLKYNDARTTWMDPIMWKKLIKTDNIRDRLVPSSDQGFLDTITAMNLSSDQEFSYLLKNRERTFDFKVRIGDQTLLAHKHILMARSEFFRGLLRFDSKEYLESTVTLDPSVFNADGLDFLISYLYLREIPDIKSRTDQFLCRILEMANFMMLQELSEFLMKKFTENLTKQLTILEKNQISLKTQVKSLKTTETTYKKAKADYDVKKAEVDAQFRVLNQNAREKESITLEEVQARLAAQVRPKPKEAEAEPKQAEAESKEAPPSDEDIPLHPPSSTPPIAPDREDLDESKPTYRVKDEPLSEEAKALNELCAEMNEFRRALEAPEKAYLKDNEAFKELVREEDEILKEVEKYVISFFHGYEICEFKGKRDLFLKTFQKKYLELGFSNLIAKHASDETLALMLTSLAGKPLDPI